VTDLPSSSPARHRRRRFAPLVWLGSLTALVVLALGVNGTLSSWTTAIITNSNNTAGAASSTVVLQETGPDGTGGTATCTTSAAANNTATCATINKYGGNTALVPGGSSSVSVTFTNTGSTTASTFTLTPMACANGGTPVGSLCANGDLTVAISCPGASTPLNLPGLSPTALTSGGPYQLGSLAAGASVTCTFTTTLLSTAPASDAGAGISQPLQWTLSV